MNQNIAHIVYASDDRFSQILGVSLLSLYENSKDMEDIIVYIFDSGIKQENKNKIESIAERYSRSKINWIKAQDISKELSMNITTDRGSLSQYARLFISRNIPNGIDRVLYLDCDTLIIKSIKSLWGLDFKGNTIAALMDAFSNVYRPNIELQKNDIMFNSGVMLIDLKKWRLQNVEKKLLCFIEKKNGQVQQGDQGVLNAVLSYDTCCFDPHFNAVTIFFDFNYRELLLYRKPAKGYYDEKKIEKAVNNPTIVHFTTSFLSKRPWMLDCKHKYVNRWLEYKNKSPWKEEPLWIDSTGTLNKIMISILKKMPRKIMLSICGLAQAYLRPWKNRLLS